MAKLYASKVAMDVTIEAVQVHGGNGFVKEYHVERHMRDAKRCQDHSDLRGNFRNTKNCYLERAFKRLIIGYLLFLQKSIEFTFSIF